MRRFVAIIPLLFLACSNSGGGGNTGRNVSGPLGLSSDCVSCANQKCSMFYNACTGSSECVGIGNSYCDCVCDHKGDNNAYSKCMDDAGKGHENTPGGNAAGALYGCLTTQCGSVCLSPDVMCGCPANSGNQDKDAFNGNDNGQPDEVSCSSCTTKFCSSYAYQCGGGKNASACQELVNCQKEHCSDVCNM